MKITTPQNKEGKNIKGPNPKKQIDTKKAKYQKRQGSGAHHAHNRQDETGKAEEAKIQC